jgi:NDP-sugar pyrophosphorylase family protein
MKAAILAAGKGERLRSITRGEPKALLKICGLPLIERILLSLVANKIKDVIVIMREDATLLEEYLKKRKNNIKITIIKRNTKSAMWSFFELEPFLKEPFLLFTVDIVYREDDFSRFIDFCRRNSKADLIIAVTSFVCDEKPVFVKFDERKRVVALGRRYLKSGDFVTAGMMYCNPRIFKEKEEALRNDIEHLSDFFGFIAEKKYNVLAVELSKVIDVDDEHDVKEAERFLGCERDES